MRLDELVTEFAAAAGITDPVAVDGVWKFSADGHVFGVTEDISSDVLWIFGEIPAPSSDREDAFRRSALEANFFMRGTCGAVFSINPESGAYTLVKSMPLSTATPEVFFKFVENFVNTLSTWKGLSDATKVAAATDAPREPAEGATAKPASGKSDEADRDAMMVFSGMLRV